MQNTKLNPEFEVNYFQNEQFAIKFLILSEI